MIYADANATYPIDPSHYDKVAQLLKEADGNPSSIHAKGRDAKVALERARANVARMLGAKGPEITFTSGATEANNMALQGLVGLRGREMRLPHVIVSAVEHRSILEVAKVLEDRGLCDLDVAPVLPNGTVDLERLVELINADTALVSVMGANNEVGALNPVQELARRVKEKAPEAHVHIDAVQLLGKTDLTWLAASTVDSASFSAHKIGAYKGIGALYLKPGKKLALLSAGGGQERGRRPGTENMPGIVSFGLKCEELHGQELAHAACMRRLRDAFIEALKRVPGAGLHGGLTAAETLPNTVNFHVEGVPGEDILLNFDLSGIAASSGSACSSGVSRPSHVLMAMGLGEWVALNSVRVSFTAEGLDEDVVRMESVLGETLARVKS